MTGKSMWSTFWSKVGAVSLRTKVIGIVAACILITAFSLLWYDSNDDLAEMRYHLQKRGITIATGLAAQSRDLIITDNRLALYGLVDDTLDADEDIVYIFVLDAADNVLVHTFDHGFPIDLLGANQVVVGEPYRVQVLQTEEDTIQDVAVPVLGGKAGVIRIGMSEVSIQAAYAEHIHTLLLLVVLILGFGLSIAYGLSSILTKPISRLSEAAQAVGRGDFNWKAPVWAKDEIGALGIAFNDMSEELNRKEKIRELLLAKVISVQEEERKRIARELHDETSQALTSLMVGLKLAEDSANTDQVKEKTAELRALAAQTLQNVHHLATELRPSVLDDLGLVAAIQKHTGEYSAKMNINVDSHVSGLGGQRLPFEVETTVYRIVQEALTNTAKYAAANNVSVVLRYRDSSLMVIIEDDGKGFDVNRVMASSNGKKLGLFGMYERA
jgi:signal transduction histidine kinase